MKPCVCICPEFLCALYLFPPYLPALLKASRGDIGHAVGLLTSQPVEVQNAGEPQKSGIPVEAWDGQKGMIHGVFIIF